MDRMHFKKFLRSLNMLSARIGMVAVYRSEFSISKVYVFVEMSFYSTFIDQETLQGFGVFQRTA